MQTSEKNGQTRNTLREPRKTWIAVQAEAAAPRGDGWAAGGGWVNGWRQVGSGVGVHDRGCRRCLRGRRCSAELAAGVLEIR